MYVYILKSEDIGCVFWKLHLKNKAMATKSLLFGLEGINTKKIIHTLYVYYK